MKARRIAGVATAQGRKKMSTAHQMLAAFKSIHGVQYRHGHTAQPSKGSSKSLPIQPAEVAPSDVLGWRVLLKKLQEAPDLECLKNACDEAQNYLTRHSGNLNTTAKMRFRTLLKYQQLLLNKLTGASTKKNIPEIEKYLGLLKNNLEKIKGEASLKLLDGFESDLKKWESFIEKRNAKQTDNSQPNANSSVSFTPETKDTEKTNSQPTVTLATKEGPAQGTNSVTSDTPPKPSKLNPKGINAGGFTPKASGSDGDDEDDEMFAELEQKLENLDVSSSPKSLLVAQPFGYEKFDDESSVVTQPSGNEKFDNESSVVAQQSNYGTFDDKASAVTKQSSNTTLDLDSDEENTSPEEDFGNSISEHSGSEADVEDEVEKFLKQESEEASALAQQESKEAIALAQQEPEEASTLPQPYSTKSDLSKPSSSLTEPLLRKNPSSVPANKPITSPKNETGCWCCWFNSKKDNNKSSNTNNMSGPDAQKMPDSTKKTM